MNRPRLERAKLLRRLQDLIGRAQSAWENDRAVDRAGPIQAALKEAFDIVLVLRSRDAAR